MVTSRRKFRSPAIRPVSDKLARALVALRSALGVRDVLTDARGQIWVLGGPQTLHRTLGPQGRIRIWLDAACPREDHWTLRSYLDNADHWSGWESAITFGLGCLGIPGEWDVTPIPALTIPRKAWSARRHRWIEAGPRPYFRFCEQPPVRVGEPGGPVLIEVASDLPPLMLSHGVSKEKLVEVRKCSGLLWPSFALSWRVPATYGDVLFFASTTVIADLLKPTGSPDPRMYLAGTDIWSPDARELRRLEKAIQWELAGDQKWWSGDREPEDGGWGQRDLQNDLLADGISAESLVGRMSYFENWQITEPIKARRQLVRRMRELFLAYTDPGDPYQYPERDPDLRISDVPYPYGELKITGLVELSDLPLVVFPRRMQKSVNRLLDDLGFAGVRLTLRYDGPLHADADEAQRRAFVGLVTRAVIDWSKDPCHTRGAKIGDVLTTDSWQSSYSAVLWWITGGRRTYDWQRGYCGTKDPGPAKARLSAPMRAWLDDKQRSPGQWGLELAVALAELDDPDMAAWFARAEQSRFLLSVADARTATARGWFPIQVSPGAEVVVIRMDTAHNPGWIHNTKSRLLA